MWFSHLVINRNWKKCFDLKIWLFSAGRAHLRGDHVLHPDRPLLHRHRADHRTHREDGEHRSEEQHGTGDDNKNLKWGEWNWSKLYLWHNKIIRKVAPKNATDQKPGKMFKVFYQ